MSKQTNPTDPRDQSQTPTPRDQLLAEVDFLIEHDLPYLERQLRATRERLQLLRQALRHQPDPQQPPPVVTLALEPAFVHDLYNEFFAHQAELFDAPKITALMIYIATRSMSPANRADTLDYLFQRVVATWLARGGRS